MRNEREYLLLRALIETSCRIQFVFSFTKMHVRITKNDQASLLIKFPICFANLHCSNKLIITRYLQH